MLWAVLARPSKGKKSRAAQLGSIIFTSIFAFISGILGVVSLYKEYQSKGLFHTYQAWIVFNLIILIPVRYFSFLNPTVSRNQKIHQVGVMRHNICTLVMRIWLNHERFSYQSAWLNQALKNELIQIPAWSNYPGDSSGCGTPLFFQS